MRKPGFRFALFATLLAVVVVLYFGIALYGRMAGA